jgi:hypothetical protein
MLDLNMPLLTDAGARDLRDLGRDLGAEASANLLRAVERADALIARAYDKRMVFVPLGILGAYVAYRIVVGLHREFGAKPAVEHTVQHLGERGAGGGH